MKVWIGLVMVVVCGMLATSVAAQPFVLDADYAFGQQLDLQVSGQTTEPVDSVTLFLQAPEFDQTYTVDQDFSPTTEPAVNQTIDLAQLQLAPFTTLTYWWIFHTPDGVDIRTPEAQLRYEDDQFTWRTLENDRFVVHWTGEDNSLGQVGLDTANAGLTRVQSIVPFTPSDPIHIYLYPTSADLRAALRLTGRDWVGAYASPELGVILVTAVNPRTAITDLNQSVPHELMHLALYQITGVNHERVPVWFHEGLATHVEQVSQSRYVTTLETAVTQQTLLDFRTLCDRFPADESNALLAYAQSADLIAFIEGRFGQVALRQLVAAWQDGADCETAVERTFNLTLPQLQQAWQQGQTQSTALPPPVTNDFFNTNGFWLLLLLGGFGVMGLIMRSI